jgi:hypothetical protein
MSQAKRSVVIGLFVLGLSACGGYNGGYTGSEPWLTANPSAGAAEEGRSANNTTTAFDGTYTGMSIQNVGGGQSGPKTVGGNVTPPCQKYDKPPTLTVTNGLAQFQALGVTFAGYVTPQGHVTMHSGYGATGTGQVKPVLVDEDFDGDFDAQTHILQGRVLGACDYKVNWQRTA